MRSQHSLLSATTLDVVGIIDQADKKLFQLVLTNPNYQSMFYCRCSAIKQINVIILEQGARQATC